MVGFMFLGKYFFINVSGNKQFQAKLLVILLIFNIFFLFIFCYQNPDKRTFKKKCRKTQRQYALRGRVERFRAGIRPI